MSDKPITREEMVEMFGSEMPIEAVQLMWNAPPEMTLGEIRARLRQMAAERAALAPPADDTFRDDLSRYASVHDDADIWERQRAERWLWENRATLLAHVDRLSAELAKERAELNRALDVIEQVTAQLAVAADTLTKD